MEGVAFRPSPGPFDFEQFAPGGPIPINRAETQTAIDVQVTSKMRAFGLENTGVSGSATGTISLFDKAPQ
jgi:hypothetical protein